MCQVLWDAALDSSTEHCLSALMQIFKKNYVRLHDNVTQASSGSFVCAASSRHSIGRAGDEKGGLVASISQL
jgi:hypothetical protein